MRPRAVVTTFLLVGMLTGATDARAATYSVNDAGDAGDLSLADTPNACDTSAAAGSQCTLRAAIQEANATNEGIENITFSIPGTGVHTLAPASPYPTLTGPVVIAGYTQPGASVNTRPVGKPLDTVLKIEIDGLDTFPSGPGAFQATGNATGSLITGLAIGNFRFASAVGTSGGASISLFGNFIGTDASGTAPRPNAIAFLASEGSSPSLIGGPERNKANLISGNSSTGIVSNEPILIEGNYIGTTFDGRSPMPNEGTAAVNVLPFQATSPSLIRDNVIARNKGIGVEVQSNSPGTQIVGNRIFDNGSIGIDLNSDGVTANDEDDLDVGPNLLQNFPVLAAAKVVATGTKLEGSLNSTADSEFRLEFFSNTERERAGRKPLDTKRVHTNAGGNVTFKVKVSQRLKGARWVTATATDTGTLSTSEFSAPRKVD